MGPYLTLKSVYFSYTVSQEGENVGGGGKNTEVKLHGLGKDFQ